MTVGMIEPQGEDIVVQGDVELDLSLLDTGYIFIKYNGSHDRLLFNLYQSEDEENLPIYVYPEKKGWQGYALPFGSGEYTLCTFAADAEATTVEAKDVEQFTFSADFSEEEPYRYRNAYSYYEEESLAVICAAYVIDEEERIQERPLSDAEKAETVVRFIYENVAWDYQLLGQIDSGEQGFYFPDADITLSTQKGLCSDWSSLAAVMLKSQGLPTRLHDGTILEPQGTGEKIASYHTWLNVYYDGAWHLYDPASSSTEIIDNKTPDPSCPKRTITGKEIDFYIEYLTDQMTVY
jgi:hypothetical protein